MTTKPFKKLPDTTPLYRKNHINSPLNFPKPTVKPIRMFANDDYVCRHLQLTQADLIKVIREKKLTTFEQIQDETDAATVCGTCVADIEEVLLKELELRKNS